MDLRLRPVREEDEQAFGEAHDSLWESDRFQLGLSYDAAEPFSRFVERHRRFARGVVDDDRVPATFLVATVGDEIVGRLSIRHELNEFLANEGGHIGYGVLKRHRRLGYATEILRQGLIVARSLGIEQALLTCDDANVASASVIERCGGTLVGTRGSSNGTVLRHYQIAL